MKSIILPTLLLVLFTVLTNAQAPDTLWTKTFGGVDWEWGYSVQECASGGFIVTGATYSFGAGNGDVYLIKTDSLGDTLWTKTYGGAGDDYGYSVQECASGGFIVAGHTESYGAGSYDVWLLRTDENGDTLWTKTYGGADTDRGNSVQECALGGFIITGWTYSFGVGDYDVYTIRTDANGDTLWTKTYGGVNTDRGCSVQECASGSFIISGWTRSFGAGSEDIYLVKIDSLGNAQWSKTYGGVLSEWGYSVQECASGDFIITGMTNSFGAGNYDVYLIRTDSLGDTLWTKTYGGSDWEWGYSVQECALDGFVITGYTRSFGAGGRDVYIIRTDLNGDTLWTKTYGGTDWDEGCSVQECALGGFIVAGVTRSFGPGGFDVWLLKMEPEIGIEEKDIALFENNNFGVSIFSGPLSFPEGKTCRIFDITGRVVIPQQIKSGIYFVEVDGQIQQKVIKIR